MLRPTLLLLCLLPLASAVPRNADCATTPDCDEGLFCLGNPGNTRCFEKKPVGMQCDIDPFWVCQDGLICVDEVCTQGLRTVADSCNTPDDVCEEPLSCVGNEGNKKCFMKKAAGMRCGQDPFWVCQDGLTCVDQVCRNVGAVAESCNDPADMCEDGLDCLGNPGKKRCEMKKGLGMRCGIDPFWVCQDGLICVDEVCTQGLRTVADSCNTPDDVCEEPLSCVGNEGNKKCFMKKAAGMRCGQDPFWVCQDGLSCTGGVCTGTAAPISTAGECNDVGDVCADGLSCVGNDGNKRCFEKKGRDMECGQDPFWVCEDKLLCVDSVCRKVVGRGKRCGKRRVCRGRLVCAGDTGSTTCVRPGKPGAECGSFDTCRNSTCVDGVCVA